MATLVITKHTDHFEVRTDTPMSNGNTQGDDWMELVGNVLRMMPCKPGHLRVGGWGFRVKLGPVSLAGVSALAVGESLTVATP